MQKKKFRNKHDKTFSKIKQKFKNQILHFRNANADKSYTISNFYVNNNLNTLHKKSKHQFIAAQFQIIQKMIQNIMTIS